MEIIVLGTGTSQGVPVIACQCPVCGSDDHRDRRLRTSVLIRNDATSLCIDAGPDFRQQMLLNCIKKLDAVIITHGHKDHTGGLDDVRAFNWIQKKPMDIYAREEVSETVKREFPYAFGQNKYPGAPQIHLKTIPKNEFTIDTIRLTPVEAMHGEMPVVGFRAGDFSYLTDASAIETRELDKMKGSAAIMINALRKEKHHSHFNLKEAVDLLNYLKPERGYLTHISHQMGFHREIQESLPDNIFLAYDGLKIFV